MNDLRFSQFLDLCSRLSPESLHEDGEISAAEANKKHKLIMQEWRHLEAKLGRQVTEEEIWNENDKRRNINAAPTLG